ncbi:hypothetical protein GGX14DRAFT_396824 [Mycena pura]|uniref:Uncharacterized protein n=1 Tax=Mycena pura TaxID=153505 RepID=A0AAD6VC10_9AGAR|nr:hypothetical protein GGX14DRAFT_396824 [Mycena pura]
MTYSTKGVDLGSLDMPANISQGKDQITKVKRYQAGICLGGINPDQSDTTTPSKRHSIGTEVGGVARPAAAEPQRRRPPVALIMAARGFGPGVSTNGTHTDNVSHGV